MSLKMKFSLLALLSIWLLESVPAVADISDSTTSTGSGTKPLIVDLQRVESADYQTYIKNLQALGCPPSTIHSIVTTDVIAAFAVRRAKAVAARYQNFKYWQVDSSGTEARNKLLAQRNAINEEMNGVLQQLLGIDTDPPDFSRPWQQEEWNLELAFLAPNKLQATKAILQEYAKVDGQMKSLAGGLNLTEDTNELQQILGRYDEEQSTLQKVLSPDEYKQVVMMTSWTAENMRHAMVHFEPTEQEFRIVFEAWHPHDEALARLHALRENDPGNLSDAIYAKIKTQLDPGRYQQYCDTWWK